ncbi:proton-conducting transporter membrane subunit [Leeuwenhoekiella sp. MAR_2009_132]|uniref:proton-conducting transporter transmembrane domain-containing protein n=1 Tax=Leeuwenhoekiella sp. MAR_2009_132 TaxID=1392489 RepID=UPI000491AAC9|nr:proton-conducting transporter membrane subunit [Leeuwenhoekiella sp. MAR_2009_132]
MISEKNLHLNTSQNFNGTTQSAPSLKISKTISFFLWFLFMSNLAYLLYFYPYLPQWHLGTLFKINGFTVLIWTTVSFFGALISSYAKTYLIGFQYYNRFMMLCLGFILSVMLFIMANHVAILLISWLAMGLFMARLIGIDSKWGEAREASKFALRYFLTGSLFLSIGVLLLAFESENFTVSGITLSVAALPNTILLIAALCIIIAALVQSAIYPFHRWLLSAMTSPTPASALMHAGFVNGSGILLALFSTVLFASNTLNILLIIGGLTAIIAQFTKLLQVNVKQKLACSTIAQMGFMIMQCGLGFFNAAVVHLILHGFYKAYLFLSSGEEVARSQPQKPLQIKIKPAQAVLVLFFGILGAFLFAFLTGKGTALNSGIFLTGIVAITVGQITYNIVKQQSLSVLQKLLLPPVLFLMGIGVYAFLYNAITVIMGDMLMIDVAVPLSAIQILFGAVFLIGFFIMKLGFYRKLPWLYMYLLKRSQPNKKSILMYKSTSL